MQIELCNCGGFVGQTDVDAEAGVKTDDIIAKALVYEANASMFWFLSIVCSFMVMILDRGNQHKRGS